MDGWWEGPSWLLFVDGPEMGPNGGSVDFPLTSLYVWGCLSSCVGKASNQ